MVLSFFQSEYKVKISQDDCIKCQKCVHQCSFDALEFNDKIIPQNHKCVNCKRCVAICPTEAIDIVENPSNHSRHSFWTSEVQRDIWKQANTGAKLLTSTGAAKSLPTYWDNILLDACQVTNPSIDPLREPMELRTYLGKKPDGVQVAEPHNSDIKGEATLVTELAPTLKLDTPIMFSAMSFGAVSLNVHKSLAMAAQEHGTYMNCGEGGLHEELEPYYSNTITQVASGRFGVDYEYLNSGAAVEIKIGQGAKPGIGGHLPGTKVGPEISNTRMIPQGSDAISPAPHHDIYSIEDLAQLIYALKEATNYKQPVGVKIAAVHNVAPIATGAVRAGADMVTIDGYRGGTGATPKQIRDNVGIPIELALSSVDTRLRQEGIRHRASIIVSGSIRSSADALKAIALGADSVSIGTAALMALGCTACQSCHTNKCAWGIATQKPELTERIDPEMGAERINNLLRGWSLEIKEILGALGLTALESLRGNRDRLRGLDLHEHELNTLGIKSAGR